MSTDHVHPEAGSPHVHLHHTPEGLDAVNFPSLVEAGPLTDEYIARTADGFIPAPEEDLDTVVGDVEKGSHSDIKLVTYTLDDKEDPRNWGKGIKWARTIVVSLTCFSVAFGSSVVVMDMDEVAADLHTSLDVVHLTIALFVLGFGVGALVFAPMSEQFGRRSIIFTSMGLYFAFTFPSAFARNAATLVVGRALAGISAAAPMTVIGGSISDMWEAADRGLPMAIFSGTVFIAPVLGPVVAGYLSEAGWRWNYYLLLIIVGLTWVLSTLMLPETYAVVLLRRRAQKLRKETGDPSYMTEEERFRMPLSEILRTALIRPMELFFTEPIILFITLYLCLLYALLYTFFFAFPIVFGEIHGWPLGSVGLSFLSIMVGMLAAYPTVVPWQNRFYTRVTQAHVEAGKKVPPEPRLPSMMIGAIILPIGLYVFAWSSYATVHWIVPMIGGFLFGLAMICIYVGANAYIVDSFPRYAASALAAKTFFSRICGAAIPMFVNRWYASAMGPRWASCLTALIATVMLPIPFLFYIYGHRIRAMSTKATS